MTIDTNLLWLALVPLLAATVWALYTFAFKPKPLLPGSYSNPRLGRRKIAIVVTPDAWGHLKEIVDEEGETETGSEYVSLIIDAEGQELIIPHVNFNRDCRPWNAKQTFAGSDSPVLICCVDRNGLRHPEMYDSIRSPRDLIQDSRLTDLSKENKRLRTEYAKLKGYTKDIVSDDVLMDRMEGLTDKIGRFRKQLFTFQTDEDTDNQQGQNRK